jgi:O-antigen/teichoic acid export membrane protein
MGAATFLIVSCQLFFILTGYALQAVLGRYLGPSDYGLFGIIYSILLIMETVFFSPISRGVTKYVAEDDTAALSAMRDGYKVMLGFCAALCAISFFGAPVIAGLLKDPQLTRHIKVFAILLPGAALFRVPLAVLNGQCAFGRQAVTLILFSLLRLCLVVCFVLLGFSLYGALWGLLLSYWLCFVIGRFLCGRLRGARRSLWKELTVFALQVVLVYLGSMLIINIDLFFVKILLQNPIATGLYAAAGTIARSPASFFMPISIVIFPMVANSLARDATQKARKQIYDALRLTLLFSLPLAAVISATSTNLTSLVFGKQFLGSGPVLSLLIIGATLLTIELIFCTVIIAGGNLYFPLLVKFVLLTITVVLNLTLIPRYQMQGAALAVTITGLIGCALSGTYIAMRMKVRIKVPTLIKIVLVSALLFAGLRAASPAGVHLLIAYAAAAIVMTFLFIALKEIGLSDLAPIKNMLFGRLRQAPAEGETPEEP